MQDLSNAMHVDVNIRWCSRTQACEILGSGEGPITILLLVIYPPNVEDGGSNIDANVLFETTNAKSFAVRVHRQVVLAPLKVVDTTSTQVVPT
jgi:hypothetical protein